MQDTGSPLTSTTVVAMLAKADEVLAKSTSTQEQRSVAAALRRSCTVYLAKKTDMRLQVVQSRFRKLAAIARSTD